MRTLLTSLLMAALVFGAPASMALAAESDEYPGTRQALPGPTFVAQRHASTLEEGVLRGTGALLRGAGEARYLGSLALINHEYARRLYIENRELATQTYFNMKRINRAARQELARPRATAQDLARYAKDRLPAVLSGQEYDRENGYVVWPSVLLLERFDGDRELIDSLVVQRSNSNVPMMELDSQIASVTDSMLKSLRVKGEDLNSTDFIKAMKFIKSLNYEARAHPTQPGEYLAGRPASNSLAGR